LFTSLEFKYPQNILFIIPAIAAVIFFILSFRKKEKIMTLLCLPYKAYLKVLRTVLLSLGLGLMVFSLAGPQIFEGYAEVEKTGLDIYVLVDTSKSMLVTDVQPDRLTVAKRIVDNLLDNLEGDRIGFIPFASDAYIQMPLTDDYQLARMFLEVMDTDMIGGGGTNLAAALELANGSFTRTSSADRVIIVLSDGEEHDEASQKALQSIMNAAGNDTNTVRAYTIGIGTEKGGLVPVYGSDGNTVVDYMKDESGNPVTSRLSADTLRRLAKDGNGTYYQASSQGLDISSLINDLSDLHRDVQTVEKIRQFKQLYQYFLGAGILLFAVAWLLPEGRNDK